jgi:hypothetical protein
VAEVDEEEAVMAGRLAPPRSSPGAHAWIIMRG